MNGSIFYLSADIIIYKLKGKNMKIVVLDGKTLTSDNDELECLKEFGELIIYSLTKPEEIAQRIEDADIVLCNKTALNSENLKTAENLKYIGLFATGYNNIDIEYCRIKSITVCNAGSYSTMAVAQHTFALILNYYNSISKYENYVAQGKWKKADTFSVFKYPMHELMGKNIGIVGYGAIGKEVGKISEAFGMNVITYSRKDNMDKFCELLKKSDIITVHCPLNNESAGMFNKKVFEQCKNTLLFVNTSRGGVVVEKDLADALNNNIIGAAAIDVLTDEPMSEECCLYDAKNITITPHVAWAPVETRRRLVNIVTENIRCFLNGNPQNKVN